MFKAVTALALAFALALPAAALTNREEKQQRAAAKAVELLNKGVEAIAKNNDAKGAVVYITKAIESGGLVEQNLQIAYFTRGAAYAQLNQCNLAIPDFGEAIKLKPEAQIYGQRGACYEKGNQIPLAIADYKQAATMDPAQAGYAGKLCGTTFNAKNYAEAAPACEIYVTKFEPTNKEIVQATAQAYEMIKNKAKANLMWKKLLALDPASKAAKEGIARTA